MDVNGLRRLIARREPGLSNLRSRLVGRNAFPKYPAHITADRATSTSETPKAIGNLFMALPSRARADELRTVGSQDPRIDLAVSQILSSRKL
jgi:hypothetical protein